MHGVAMALGTWQGKGHGRVLPGGPFQTQIPVQLFLSLYKEAVLASYVLKGCIILQLDFLGKEVNKDTNELCNR